MIELTITFVINLLTMIPLLSDNHKLSSLQETRLWLPRLKSATAAPEDFPWTAGRTPWKIGTESGKIDRHGDLIMENGDLVRVNSNINMIEPSKMGT